MEISELGFAGKYIEISKKKNAPSVGEFFSNLIIQMEKKLPDVSFWQGRIDWDKMRTMTNAVIIRLGQNRWIDTEFVRNWSEAKRVGMVRGVYWFYDDRVSPDEQAQLAINALKADKPEMEFFADWENAYGGSYSKLSDVVRFMRLVEIGLGVRAGLYTGYYWFKDHSTVTQYPSEYVYLSTKPLWLAWYTSNPDYVKVPAPWTDVTFWQYGTPALGQQYGTQTTEIDMNYFNGTIADFNARYAVPPVIVPGDEKISTHKGVDYYHIRRFNTDCYIHVIDLTKVRAKIHLGFMTVFDAVNVYGAQLGFNMGGWGDLPDTSAPDEYLVIDGVVKQDKMTGSGWIDISRDNKITIDTAHPNFPTRWNLWGFDRIIAKNRVYNPAITNPNSDPRTINGKDGQGRLVILVCEGRSPNQKGLTFPEVWSVMQEFDVIDCGNADGGYSSASVDTYFIPPLRNSTYLVENRRVVSQLLLYTDEPVGGDVKTYKVLVSVKPRPTPSISGGTSANIPAGTVFQSDTVVAGLPTGTNFVKYISGEWLPLVYNGVEYVKDITPPDVYQLPPYVYLELPDGTRGKYNKEQL